MRDKNLPLYFYLPMKALKSTWRGLLLNGCHGFHANQTKPKSIQYRAEVLIVKNTRM